MRFVAREPRSGPGRLAQPTASRARIAIIRAEYNREITLSLQEKCVETLIQSGVRRDDILTYSVPGCFEIPLVAARLAAKKHHDVLIALGAVIRGETHHFDLIANECARGVMEVSLRHNVPIIFEVLATYNRRDALRRSGNNRSNKGIEAAEAALAVLKTLDAMKR